MYQCYSTSAFFLFAPENFKEAHTAGEKTFGLGIVYPDSEKRISQLPDSDPKRDVEAVYCRRDV